MMRSKGQVTLYVVMAILILVIVFLSFYIISDDSGDVPTHQKKGFDTTGVENMIDSCIEKTGMEGLRLLGEKGNYIRRPDLLKVDDTSYWIYRYSNVEPIFNTSKGDFEQWFDEELKECVDFSSFTGYEISEGEVNSSIMYGAEDVVIDVHYPLNITRGEREKRLEDFSHTLNIRYRRILERAKEIVEAHYQQNFDYRDALEFVGERDFNITYEIMDEDNLKFTIMDPVSYQGNYYTFKFATNLNRSHVTRTVDVSEKSLHFYEPFKVYSPNRRAVLTLEPGIKVSDGPIEIWPDYSPVGTLYNVTTDIKYTLSGGKVTPGPQKQENLTWSLHYPIYHFTPNKTRFYSSESKTPNLQKLRLYWDEEKNPNRGRVGILYKGSMSKNEWVPHKSNPNYEENYVETEIFGFSSYTVVDCARQSCKSSEVTSESEPSGMCFGWVIDIFIIIIAFFISLITGQWWIFVAALGMSGTSMMAGFQSGNTHVTLMPTCDQKVELTCTTSGAFADGYGQLNDVKIDGEGTKTITVSGGKPQRLTAVAKECEKTAFSCKSCSITCSVSYK